MEKVQQTIYGMPKQFRAIVEKIRESSPMKPIKNEIYLRALEIGLNQLLNPQCNFPSTGDHHEDTYTRRL